MNQSRTLRFNFAFGLIFGLAQSASLQAQYQAVTTVFPKATLNHTLSKMSAWTQPESMRAPILLAACGTKRNQGQVANPRKEIELMKSLSFFAISAALALLVVLGGPGAHAQAEIDPDHFDSPNTEAIPQPKTVDSKTTPARYERTFSLPYSVLCNGKKLGPGTYSISIRSDGKVGQATLNQKGRTIETMGVIQTEAQKQRDEVVVVEKNENGRTLSVVRVRGLAFVFDPKHSAGPSAKKIPTRTEKLPMTVIATNEIAQPVPSQASLKP